MQARILLHQFGQSEQKGAAFIALFEQKVHIIYQNEQVLMLGEGLKA